MRYTMRQCLAAAATAVLLAGTISTSSLAQDGSAGELSPEAQRAIGEAWLDGLEAYYASGDPQDLPSTTEQGLERLRSFDWRFDAVETGQARFAESWTLIDSLPVDMEMTDGETTAIDLRLTYEVAERATEVDAESGEPTALALGPERRVMLATFVHDAVTDEWSLDDIGLPPGGSYDFGLLASAPVTPCPGLSKARAGADPFLVTPWCTAGGDGREVVAGRLSPRSGVAPEILVRTAGCDWDDALVMSLGWPPGAPRDMLQSREYVRDPKDQVPGADAYRRDVRKPKDAISTGITNGQATIWTGETLGEDAILVQVGSRFERWPRVAAGCTGN